MHAALAQTLHGYDDGHRLLASSVELRGDEHEVLDRLTDLSGPPPLGFEFTSYLNAFPCGRFQALCRTWHDPTGARRGTVLSHTLLVPAERPLTPSLRTFDSLFRQPESPRDRAPYRTPLELPWPEAPDAPGPPLDDADTLTLALLFSGALPPLLREVDAHGDVAAARLWDALPPSLRPQLWFCTMALGVRRHPRGPFSLLFAPASLFPSLSGDISRACRVEFTATPSLPEHVDLLDRPWVASLREAPRRWADTVLRWCSDAGCEPPPLGQFASVERVRQMADAARRRVTAARGRADLALHLWPDLGASSPLAHELVRDLIRTQPEAALRPAPFWELIHLLKRPLLRTLLAESSEVTVELAATVRAEVERRLSIAEDVAWTHVAQVFEAAHEIDGLSASVFDAAVAAAGAVAPRTLAEILQRHLDAWPEARRQAFVERVFAMLPQEARRSVVRSEAARTGATAALVRDLVLRGDDAALVYDLHSGVEGGALEATTRWALAEAHRVSSLRTVLLHVAPMEALRWALDHPEPLLSSLTCEVGVKAWQELSLSPKEFTPLARQAPNGTMLLPAVASVLPSAARIAWLRDDSWALDALLRAELTTPHVDATSQRFDEVLTAFLSAESLSYAGRSAFESAAPSPRRTRLLGVAIRRSIMFALTRDDVPSEALWCLDAAEGREWLALASQTALAALFPLSLDAPRTLPRTARLVRESLDRAPGPSDWALSLVTLPLRQASGTAFDDAAKDLEAFQREIVSEHTARRFAAEVLVTTRRRWPARAASLVERSFPLIYPLLFDGDQDPFEAAGWRSWSWDRARDWRHWLVDVWLQHGWPTESFLRALGGDVELLRRVRNNVRRRGERGSRWIGDWVRCLEATPAFAGAFRGRALEVLAEVPGWFDPD